MKCPVILTRKNNNTPCIIRGFRLMAKQAKEPKQKAIEETLWDSANKLRGSV
jgi:hypothetical protein